jgi:hypothetical protein
MARSQSDDPQYWRERANDARELAEHLTAPTAKQTMLDIAADWERLANRAANTPRDN